MEKCISKNSGSRNIQWVIKNTIQSAATSVFMLVPNPGQANNVDTLRTIWDIWYNLPWVIAAVCAAPKWNLDEVFIRQNLYSEFADYFQRSIWNAWIWKRPNGSIEDSSAQWWAPSKHTTNSVGWALLAHQYCDSDMIKMFTSWLAATTAISRIVPDENWHSPHTPVQVVLWVTLAYTLHTLSDEKYMSTLLSEKFRIHEDSVNFNPHVYTESNQTITYWGNLTLALWADNNIWNPDSVASPEWVGYISFLDALGYTHEINAGEIISSF